MRSDTPPRRVVSSRSRRVIAMMSPSPSGSFEAGERYALGDAPLEDEVDNQDGQDDQHRRRHGEVLARAVLSVIPGEHNRQGAPLRRLDDDERPDVVVPGTHELEDAQG